MIMIPMSDQFKIQQDQQEVLMVVIIAGSRSSGFTMDDLNQAVNAFEYKISRVCCGCARGVDGLGFEWAKKNHIPVAHFAADWKAYGKAAGPERNRAMAKYAKSLHGGLLLLRGPGFSPGSDNMLLCARYFNMPFLVWNTFSGPCDWSAPSCNASARQLHLPGL